jgi:N6-L-threonylcarbamoyladenine synthase
MIILGIESSCDDTGVAVVRANADGSFEILANEIAAQDHVRTGGVVPEVAARRHAANLLPTLDVALEKARLEMDDIEMIAVTTTPGLISCLQVGIESAKTLAVAHKKPIIGVHHMRAHIASTFAEHPHVQFPAVVLLASGGHTMIVRMNDAEQYEILGQTRDDAAGEAFDKIAKMLGLPYPGGPEIARIAAGDGNGDVPGNPKAFEFPRPMLSDASYEFSFAGLKTSVLYTIRDLGGVSALTQQQKADIAASVQEAIVDVLVKKTVRAAIESNAQSIILGGGVSANAELRTRLADLSAEGVPHTDVIVPSPGLFTDNGAMIAIAAAPRALRGEFDDPHSLHAVARTPIHEWK